MPNQTPTGRDQRPTSNATMEAADISVIIPVKLEFDLRSRLKTLRQLICVKEIIVIDSSKGATKEELSDLCTYVHDPSLDNRSQAMNHGAALAKGTTLWFLHSDCMPPVSAEKQINLKMERGQLCGAFFKKYDPENFLLIAQSAILNTTSLISKRWLVGTNAFFIQKTAFQNMGGFKNLPFLEDIAFARSLSKHHSITMIKEPIAVSSRKYVRYLGIQRILINVAIILLFECGVPPQKLYKWYKFNS